jgi:hypothetical protein
MTEPDYTVINFLIPNLPYQGRLDKMRSAGKTSVQIPRKISPREIYLIRNEISDALVASIKKP